MLAFVSSVPLIAFKCFFFFCFFFCFFFLVKKQELDV